MITYELAKRLKDEGFPQGDRLFYFHDKAFHSIEVLPKDWKEMEQVAAPTLSELIFACPTYIFDEEFNLHATHEEGKVEWWACYIQAGNLNEPSKYPSNGSTPEEAVANLWLALNEKKIT